jgi:hypothetical protein
VPAEKEPELLTLGPGPLSGVGPFALNVKSAGDLFPASLPCELSTNLTSVRPGATSLFVIVQIFVSPLPIVPEQSFAGLARDQFISKPHRVPMRQE